MGYPNNIRCEASEHLRNKRENIWKPKFMSWQQTGRTRILQNCIQE
jgi:hypothetical protein